MVKPLWKTIWWFLIQYSIQASNPLLRCIYPREMETHVYTGNFLFSLLRMVVVILPCMCVKTHGTVHLQLVGLTVYKLCLNQAD